MFLNCVAIIGGSLLGGLLFNYIQKKQKVTYKCIFHRPGRVILMEDSCTNYHSSNTLQHIIDFIDEAEHTVDLCFYMITELQVILAIIRARDRKIKVRLITDQHDGIEPNKNFGILYKEGVKVYAKLYNDFFAIMHNKFIIRDSTTLLQGSLNLTTTTACSSFDNVIITNDPALVKDFENYFQDIVNIFE